ncbi:MAG: hypothetical protein WDZ45_10865 [Flavobacteriaceae bacterium]
MKTQHNHFNKPIIQQALLIVISFFLLVGCRDNNEEKKQEPNAEEQLMLDAKAMKRLSDREAIEVVTEIMDFQMPGQIPSGWNTFRYINKSEETHFFVFEKMPENKTIEDSKAEVFPVFQEAMDLINQGEPDKGFKTFEKLPAWFYDVKFTGGTGLIAPKSTAETTLYLEPGYYIIECYVKMPNGMFHSVMGMAKEIVVTDNSSDHEPPKATMEIALSSEEGIQFDKQNIEAGLQTIAVHFKDQKVYGNYVGHDLHIAKVEQVADMETLSNWMNWATPEGFKTPVPEGVKFLGGSQEMPEGSTAYFHVLLEPGNYIFVAEVPSPEQKNMLHSFVVTEAPEE